MLSERDLQSKIIEMRPWGHEILLPYDLVTARPPYHEESYPGEKNHQEYRPNGKYVKLEKAGAFEGTFPPAKVIDVGCGGGWFSIHFAVLGYEVWAVDESLKAIEKVRFLKELLGLSNLSISRGDVSAIRFGVGDDDLVLALGLIHHLGKEGDETRLTRREAFLGYCYDTLKPGGAIIVETKPEVPCEKLLRDAGFEPRRLHGAPRSSWRGEKKRG